MSRREMYFLTLGSTAIMSYMTNLNELNGDEWATWSWVGWSRFAGSVIVQVLIAWKALATQLPPKTPKNGESNATEKGNQP